MERTRTRIVREVDDLQIPQRRALSIRGLTGHGTGDVATDAVNIVLDQLQNAEGAVPLGGVVRAKPLGRGGRRKRCAHAHAACGVIAGAVQTLTRDEQELSISGVEVRMFLLDTGARQVVGGVIRRVEPNRVRCGGLVKVRHKESHQLGLRGDDARTGLVGANRVAYGGQGDVADRNRIGIIIQLQVVRIIGTGARNNQTRSRRRIPARSDIRGC